ncbi:MAG TPA: rRNA maturation RNase YbeY [Stellaceae bacterium]|nr:rRNA maturation RNase YbeY [Stellaceae bacterium]
MTPSRQDPRLRTSTVPLTKPPMTITVLASGSAWQGHVPTARRICRKAARGALDAAWTHASFLTTSSAAELTVVLAGDEVVRTLNRQWRGEDKATNVLAFEARDTTSPKEAPRYIGDVVLAFETVTAEAAAQGKKFEDHLAHLVVHGVLHLLGFDHEKEEDAHAMEALEIKILARLGIGNPYAAAEALLG